MSTLAPAFDGETFEALDAPGALVFEVNPEARTIRGLIVPYGVVGVSKGVRFQFSRGTLRWADVSRVKLWIRHDPNRAVGRATDLEETDAGLVGTFSVARGPAGDEALSMAEDGVWDGLSIGLGTGGQFRRTRDGVHHAVAVPLSETSLTPSPAFDDARVHAVAAETDSTRGPLMECTTCGAVHAAGVTECDPTTRAAFEATNGGDPTDGATFDAIAQAIQAGFAAVAAGAGPEVIPAGGQRADSITEAAPYVFDGATTGEHEFSSDLFAGMRGDAESRQRVHTFMAEQINPATFAVTPDDVATLNPATNRPDMYVDRLVQATPLWQALRKGGLSDNTPFVFPKFVSAGNLVSKHVLMREPEPGNFKTGKQTVTPGPLSGKVEIPREIADAGGNPQVSRLIWREMERAYYAALEAEVSAMLEDANPNRIVIPEGAEDAELVDYLEAAYADLQFIDGGFRFDYAPTERGLYKGLTAASDSTGRKLLPIIGATNANGGATRRFATVDVAGVTHLPVPTLEPGVNGALPGPASSYLLASEDVHAWASPPRELRFEYQVAHIDMGIWGYVATAISRLAGVLEVEYDNTPRAELIEP